MIVFKFPFNDQFFTAGETNSHETVTFVPFDSDETISFTGPLKKLDPENIPGVSSENLPVVPEIVPESEEEYIRKISSVIAFIKENKLDKLVVARKKTVRFNNADLEKTFLNLCNAFPNAFTYFFVKDGVCWVGSFSEVLGKFRKQNCSFETMSLAGTLPLDETWSKKEIEEQQPVTEYIAEILRGYSSEIEQSHVYDHISGNIKHLRTDFKAKIKKEELEDLIATLHPTPAVCGIPKSLCKNAIKKFENFSRNFYSGYIRVETEESIDYYVNLRCAAIYRNGAEIFVGGGITQESDPYKEWRETELKAQAILKNLITF